MDFLLEVIQRMLLKWQLLSWTIGHHLLKNVMVKEVTRQSISGDGPVEFHLSADPEKFTDICTVLTLHGGVGVKVKEGDGILKPVSSLSPQPESKVFTNHFAHPLQQK